MVKLLSHVWLAKEELFIIFNSGRMDRPTEPLLSALQGRSHGRRNFKRREMMFIYFVNARLWKRKGLNDFLSPFLRVIIFPLSR